MLSYKTAQHIKELKDPKISAPRLGPFIFFLQKIITIHQRHLAATIRTFLKSHPLEEWLNHYRSLRPFLTINIDFIVPVQNSDTESSRLKPQ
ncbi:hypothetical protein OUZ56_001653 [Daphnia magna]|uniref:Uncharacterized protein n=1 Tax=Daphnia magna TaxID=35525 RepID=A0ABR0A3B2_9CRUS|nr:hypothetical protein OUZ56_001653 [Daphnia magna]